MSIKNWPGGVVRATPVTPSGPYQNSSASGIWTLDQQAYWDNQNLWPTAGNLDPSLFIENIFSTYLYTGNSSTQTITNDINLSGQGGLVWIKDRTNIADHRLIDTVTGAQKELISNQTTAQVARTTGLTAFNNNGFSLGSASGYNTTATNYVSWAFREQSKFFDVVTYTGNGIARTIPHNLGSVPGCIIVKVTSAAGNWWVYHRSLTNAQYLVLNTTAAVASGSLWNSTTPTATEFSIGATSDINNSGATYVAYLFAHDAGGFGTAGTDNVISCGSYTGTGAAGNFVSLGYEPQWVLIKNASAAQDWFLFDSMRGLVTGSGGDLYLNPNLSSAEGAAGTYVAANATGFTLEGGTTGLNGSAATYIYIAIRRGPMRTPTSGTSVFIPVTYAGNGSTTTGQLVSAGFTVDMGINRYNRAGTGDWDVVDRLRGLTSIGVTPASRYLNPHNTNAEASGGYIFDATNTSVDNYGFSASFTQLNYLFRRAPGFFDVVCYTGTGSATTITHNLASVPELMIVKTRSTVDFWYVYHKDVGNTKYLQLQSTAAPATSSVVWNNTTPTSSVFSVGVATNGSGVTHVAYLFSTVTGVSKVGSYTGTGTTSVKQVDCGFTGGARFVLIKRTDSTGDWYIWDSARGIVAGNDPYLLLNSTAAEVTTTDWVDTYSLGFELSTASGNNVNINNATYIFLAIA